MNTKTKPAAQLSLELILEQNRAEAERLLAENARIETEMTKILGDVQPPPSKLVEAFEEAIPHHKNGKTMERMITENSTTLPPVSERLASERDVVYAAVAIVRSWERRHKKKYHNQERELAAAVAKLKWEK